MDALSGLTFDAIVSIQIWPTKNHTTHFKMNILNIICMHTTIQSSTNKETLYGPVKPNKYTATELDGLLS